VSFSHWCQAKMMVGGCFVMYRPLQWCVKSWSLSVNSHISSVTRLYSALLRRTPRLLKLVQVCVCVSRKTNSDSNNITDIHRTSSVGCRPHKLMNCANWEIYKIFLSHSSLIIAHNILSGVLSIIAFYLTFYVAFLLHCIALYMCTCTVLSLAATL